MKKFLTISLVVALAILTSGCSKQSAADTPTDSGTLESPISDQAQLTIKDFQFQPNKLVVKVGTVVGVANQDKVAHSITADDGSFDTGLIDKGKSGSLTLDQAGTFTFHCTPHPFMTGTITVVD
ncbi:cupredoxin domain-containing protein [Candidatus Berkelbacteria bacterium]|nr:cupredoxin domain-containing protein [Candidatus Berkelbacteria bacterium]